MRNKLKPIQELRIRKAELMRECSDHENRIIESSLFVKKHFGTLLLGFVFSRKEKTILHSVDEGLVGGRIWAPVYSIGKKYAPIAWGIVQPMLLNAGLNRLKSIFKRNNKYKKTKIST